MSHIKDQKGVIAIIVGLCIVVLTGMVALAVDIGYLMVTRNELQNIADGAALAAARQLGVIYESMTDVEQWSYVCNPADLIVVAQAVAQQNRAGGVEDINIRSEDVVIGTWDTESKTLTPTLNQPNAVSVTSRRDDSANSPVSTFFARILGIDEVPVSAEAVAALTSQSTSNEGGLPIPVALSMCKFTSPFCGEKVQFYPTRDSEAGWHCYEAANCNSADLNKIIAGLINGTYESPETVAGETRFEFTGGTVANIFDPLKALFDAMKILNDGILDADEDPTTWTTSLAVYYVDDCDAVFNPAGDLLIIGFATIVIEEVIGPEVHEINGTILCDLTEPGRGGGSFGGWQFGSIPNLVR